MNQKSYEEKRYAAARHRFLGGAVEEFFQREFSKFFGPLLRTRIVEELLRLLESLELDQARIRPGQCLWLAVDQKTRADSPRRELRPVILTLIDQADVVRLAKGTPMRQIGSEAIARMMREAHQQGGLLSMRDIELLTWHSSGALTEYRQRYEREHDCVLPHTGTLHDMGSCITHKGVIIKKAIEQGKDPRLVARETHHTLKSVEHYLRDYERVKQCYGSLESVEAISAVTGIARHVVQQYIDIIVAQT